MMISWRDLVAWGAVILLSDVTYHAAKLQPLALLINVPVAIYVIVTWWEARKAWKARKHHEQS